MHLILEGFINALQLIFTFDRLTYEIALLSLVVSGIATLAAAITGIPLGIALASRDLPFKRLLEAAINTSMGLPPILVGLVIALLLWRSGPLGDLGLIYTPAAMIVAQFLVVVPITTNLTRSAILSSNYELIEAMRTDGASELRISYELVRLLRQQIVVAVAAGFGRAIAEVGASLIVGGNILHYTRVLTTAIALEVNRGNFDRAIALGIILLLISLLVNLLLLALGNRSIPFPSRLSAS
ncbi:binding-protein-dependent transport systems inner membrane component [Thermobaculum terrenum ATCC BAA-798]|uniref:Binding-protein-dependent transport systems inner membrane component n=1 Tax=Thermobaculum terrenum (strain ATCC BAA-798 / CCMEE 7001 / YNP1) TaxID=525904 RepID=D1CCW3_THET1|nr:ABC transporter permease [Thermobaculum terrenum]ACZ42628.1 binding-protein-dependent transport systems inner membrane component [Thermobaculum terrenum ATCC BAA-798]